MPGRKRYTARSQDRRRAGAAVINTRTGRPGGPSTSQGPQVVTAGSLPQEEVNTRGHTCPQQVRATGRARAKAAGLGQWRGEWGPSRSRRQVCGPSKGLLSLSSQQQSFKAAGDLVRPRGNKLTGVGGCPRGDWDPLPGRPTGQDTW